MLSEWIRRLWPRRASAPVPEDAAERGRWGEAQAADYLLGKGYRILGRRVRPNRHDEIDLVARTSDTLVFVEVKTRSNLSFGRPAAAVRRDKRRALNRAASCYLRRLGFPRLYYRFDVIEVVCEPGQAPTVHHVPNAFPFEARRRSPL